MKSELTFQRKRTGPMKSISFVTFYFSPYERCSVYLNKNITVTGHKSDFYSATTDKVKPVLVSRQQYVISRSTLTFLSLSDSSLAEN